MAKGDVVEASWLEEDAAKIDFLSAANSYVHLSDDQQPWYRAQRAVEREEDDCDLARSARRPFALRVRNLPRELHEEGVRNIFSKFGNVLDVVIMRHSSPHWAKVTFASHLEAQTAKMRLDGADPFKLSVSSLGPERRDRKEGGGDDPFKNHPFRGYADSSREQFKEEQKLVEAELLKQLQNIDEEEVDPSEGGGDRGRVQAVLEEKEKKEEGEVKANDPPRMRSFGAQVVIPYDVPSFCSNSGVCQAAGRFRCSRCKAWYCSQGCQVDHWQRHVLVCRPPPVLEYPDGNPFFADKKKDFVAKESEEKATQAEEVAVETSDADCLRAKDFPSALDGLKVGSRLALYASDVEDDTAFSAGGFLALACDGEAFEFVFGEMQDKLEDSFRQGSLETAASSCCPGRLVLWRKQEEEFIRGLVMATRGDKAKIFNVDLGTSKWSLLDSLFKATPCVFSRSFPALAVFLDHVGGELTKTEADDLRKRLVRDPTFEVLVEQAADEPDGLASCSLILDGDEHLQVEVGRYLVRPWRTISPPVAALLE